MAVLSYMDFFSMGLQRTAAATAANICKHASPASFDLVSDSVPILSNLLEHSDAAIVQSACLCMSRLVASLAIDASKLEKLTSCGLLPKLVTCLFSLLVFLVFFS